MPARPTLTLRCSHSFRLPGPSPCLWRFRPTPFRSAGPGVLFCSPPLVTRDLLLFQNVPTPEQHPTGSSPPKPQAHNTFRTPAPRGTQTPKTRGPRQPRPRTPAASRPARLGVKRVSVRRSSRCCGPKGVSNCQRMRSAPALCRASRLGFALAAFDDGELSLRACGRDCAGTARAMSKRGGRLAVCSVQGQGLQPPLRSVGSARIEVAQAVHVSSGLQSAHLSASACWRVQPRWRSAYRATKELALQLYAQ